MRIAVASGKGGTGKTTIATGLALSMASVGRPVAYIDCDVEEPNGHIYLKPELDVREAATTSVPIVDHGACTLCRRCVDVCRYNALAVAGGGVLSFPELCHACGACVLACPEKAISEKPREVGVVERGHAGPVEFVHGMLTVGEAMPIPVLRNVIERIPAGPLAILDAPPGTSCPVVETLSSVDLVVLVVEPTPFGLHDFGLTAELVGELDVPACVVVNKADGSSRADDAAASSGMEVLASFPDERATAEACSRGEHPVGGDPAYAEEMARLRRAVMGRLGGGETR
jgi:MinD superfamily P-loop ATPase